jgi:hypothetical protein
MGGTLGIAVIGSVYASLYTSRLTGMLPAGLPASVARSSYASIGAALATASKLDLTGHAELAASVRNAASSAFFTGFHTGDYVAAGVTAIGALMALWLLPAHPRASLREAADVRTASLPVSSSAQS